MITRESGQTIKKWLNKMIYIKNLEIGNLMKNPKENEFLITEYKNQINEIEKSILEIENEIM